MEMCFTLSAVVNVQLVDMIFLFSDFIFCVAINSEFPAGVSTVLLYFYARITFEIQGNEN